MTRIFYAAFDLFPSPKGAATHMGHNLLAARELFDASTLFCLGAPDMPSYQEEGSITIHRCLLNHPNFLRRVDLYQASLDEIREHATEELNRLPEPLRSFQQDFLYPVKISDHLNKLAQSLAKKFK